MDEKTTSEIKKPYSYRQYPTAYDETMKNAKACGTTIAQIIDDAFDEFNKNFDKMRGEKK